MNLHDEIVEDDGTDGFLGEVYPLAWLPGHFCFFGNLGVKVADFAVAPGGKLLHVFFKYIQVQFFGRPKWFEINIVECSRPKSMAWFWPQTIGHIHPYPIQPDFYRNEAIQN